MFNRNRIKVFFAIVFFALICLHAQALMKGWVEIPVSVSSNNRPIENATVEVYENGSLVQTYPTKANGNVTVKLNLNKQCKIYFKKGGLVTKYVEYNTIVPESENDQIIPAAKFAIELFEDKGDLSQKDAVNKPVAKYIYNTTYEDFIFDDSYSKQVKAEQEQARREAEALAKQKDKGRLDSLNKIWNDSLLLAKDRQSKLLTDKAEQDRIRKEQEKARQDSIARASADAKTMADLDAKEKARKDSIAKAEAEKERLETLAKSKATADSLAKLEADKRKLLDMEKVRLLAEARDKARQDSTSKAVLDKSRKDSLASVKAKADLEVASKQKEQFRKDSLARAEVASKVREKFVTDSISKAGVALKVHEKFVTDSLAKVESDKSKAEALAKTKADADAKVRETYRRDSVLKAESSLKERQKFISDSTAQAKVDKAKNDALAKSLVDAEKARQKTVADSTAKANADKVKQDALAKVKADADAKSKADAEALLKVQERKDALAKTEADKARQKFVADSTARATSDKVKQDALAKVKADADAKSKADAEALVKVQERRDALAKTEADKARQKFVVDSTARASADKAKQDALAKNLAEADAKAKAEEERLKLVADEKAKSNANAQADREQKEKEDADRKAKVQADIQAKKDLLTKTYTSDDKEKTTLAKSTTAVPKIRDSDYKEGVTEETVAETNRSIFRVVIKKDGATYNYQKIVYKWGGVFYFKNDNSITESTYVQDIKNAKAVLKN